MSADDNRIGGKWRENPVHADESRGKNRERRKHREDGPTLTPTEAHIKGQLMRQFMKNPEGTSLADTNAYKSSPAWCRTLMCKHLATKDGLCDDCAVLGVLA